MKNKNLLIILLLFPILSFAQIGTFPQSSPPCFTLNVNQDADQPGCVDIRIDIDETLMGSTNSVTISDGMGNTATCSSDCLVTWCYPGGAGLVYIVAWTNVRKDCSSSDGELIFVGSGQF